MAKKIKSVAEVIEALDGINAVSSLVGVGPNAVRNWLTRGLPPETYVVLTRALEGKGHTASPSLWQMRAISD